MKIRGVLKDDIQTRAKLVENPAEDLDLLVHVLFALGTEVELNWSEGSLTGDESLVLYVETCVSRGRAVAVGANSTMVPASLDDPHTVVALVRELFEPKTFSVEYDPSEPVEQQQRLLA